MLYYGAKFKWTCDRDEEIPRPAWLLPNNFSAVLTEDNHHKQLPINKQVGLLELIDLFLTANFSPNEDLYLNYQTIYLYDFTILNWLYCAQLVIEDKQ